jgi:hypothetical protein
MVELVQVPSLTTFLANDETLPASPIYVYQTNLGSGNGSSAANAKEIQAAINAATAGQNLVAIAASPGATTFYNRFNGLTLSSAANGTSGSKITLSARPRDTVVISRGEQFAGARTPNSGFWESSAFDAGKQIWRSVATNFGAARALSGQWIEFGWPHFIPRYNNLTDLSKPVGNADMPTNYAGPGAVVHTDGRVYIRMQRPHPAKYSVGNKWPNDGRFFGAAGQEVVNGRLAFPVTQNPKDYVIYLAEHGGSAFTLAGKQWWAFGGGINSAGYMRMVECNAASDISFGRGLHLVHRFGMQTSSATTARLSCNRTRISVGSHRHISFVEFKFGGRYFEGNSRGSLWETSSTALFDRWTFRDCTLHGWFDLCVGGAPGNHRFLNCTIVDTMDDGIQHNPSNTHNIEFGWCYFRDCGFDGPDDGSGGNTNPWYIHHNIMDYRAIRVVDVFGKEPYPMALVQFHSPNANRPGKYFNNTVIVMTDTADQQRIPFNHFHGDRANQHPNFYNECFNNILTVCNGDVGTSTRYTSTSPFPGRADQVMRGVRPVTTDSKEIFNYNLYWRDPALAPFTKGLIQTRQGSTLTERATLAAAKSAYPQFEPNGVEAKPIIASLDNFPADRLKYRPAANSDVLTAYSNQTTSPAGESMSGWPAKPSPWKGALDPNGTTVPVGVQKP